MAIKKEDQSRFDDFFGEDPMNTDKLHPDLKPYLEVLPKLGTCLRHPLVYQIMGVMWKPANAMYEQKTKDLEEYLDKKRFDRALWLYERPYRLTMLLEWAESEWLTDDMLEELLISAWIDTEMPGHREDMDAVLELFQRFDHILTDGPMPPTGMITVWRGVGREEDSHGISWTRDKDRAAWFAGRWAKDGGHLFEAEIPLGGILAVFAGRGETEVVVDPDFLENVRRVGKGRKGRINPRKEA